MRKSIVVLVSTSVALTIALAGAGPSSAAPKGCPTGSIVGASDLAKAEGCDLANHKLVVDDIELRIPAAGEGLGAAASRMQGDTRVTEILVRTAVDGTVAMSVDGAAPVGGAAAKEELSATMTAAARQPNASAVITPLALPSWCGDLTQYAFTGQTFPNDSWPWYYNSSFQPSTSAASVITKGINAMEADSSSCGTWATLVTGNQSGSTNAAPLTNDRINTIGWGTISPLALTVWWYSGSSTYEADASFNKAKSWYVGTGTVTSGKYDLFSIAAHESGHVFGLKDLTSTPKQVMYGSFATGASRREKRCGDLWALWYLA